MSYYLFTLEKKIVRYDGGGHDPNISLGANKAFGKKKASNGTKEDVCLKWL